jgi:hypothetical protein
MMTSKTLSYLWKLTWIAALILLLATVGLILKAKAAAQAEVVVFVTSPSNSAYLRAKSDGSSKILTILENGTPVLVKNTRSVAGEDWYYVQTETHSGWLPFENISLEAP